MVVDEGDVGGLRGESFAEGEVVGGGVVAVGDGEGVPGGRDVWGDGELVAREVEAEDVFYGDFVGPGGGAGVPCPAAPSGVLRVGVDVGSDAVGFDFVFEGVGEGGGALDGVDE